MAREQSNNTGNRDTAKKVAIGMAVVSGVVAAGVMMADKGTKKKIAKAGNNLKDKAVEGYDTVYHQLGGANEAATSTKGRSKKRGRKATKQTRKSTEA